MPSLDDDFQRLMSRLTEPGPASTARGDPFYYFVYPTEMALDVKRNLPAWTARLRNAGIAVARVSFSDLLWQIIDASGRWREWLEVEPGFDQEQVNESIRSVLRNGDGLVAKVAEIVGTERPDTVVFLTETEMLHPYFRVRTLESALHDRVKVPTVVFYPGERASQFGLRFLGFYSEDGNYRATLIGGVG